MYEHERSLVTRFANRPFVLLGVNSDQDPSVPQALQKKGTVTWRSFQDMSMNPKVSDRWHVQGWPTLYLIDETGTLRKIYVGAPDPNELSNAIERLVIAAESNARVTSLSQMHCLARARESVPPDGWASWR